MSNRNAKRRATSVLLLPLLFLTGCSSVLGLGPRLAPEDEPYLFDRWDPDFELAKPCEDLSEQAIASAGLSPLEGGFDSSKVDGLDSCTFLDENQASVMVNGLAAKLLKLQTEGVPLSYAPNPEKQPVLAYSQEGDSGCSIAAETTRGTVEVIYDRGYFEKLNPEIDCVQAEKYFDLLIGEKLNEYRTN